MVRNYHGKKKKKRNIRSYMQIQEPQATVSKMFFRMRYGIPKSKWQRLTENFKLTILKKLGLMPDTIRSKDVCR